MGNSLKGQGRDEKPRKVKIQAEGAIYLKAWKFSKVGFV